MLIRISSFIHRRDIDPVMIRIITSQAPIARDDRQHDLFC